MDSQVRHTLGHEVPLRLQDESEMCGYCHIDTGNLYLQAWPRGCLEAVANSNRSSRDSKRLAARAGPLTALWLRALLDRVSPEFGLSRRRDRA